MSTYYGNLLRQRYAQEPSMSGSALMGGVLGGKLNDTDIAKIKAIRDEATLRTAKEGVMMNQFQKNGGSKKVLIQGQQYLDRLAKSKVSRKITSDANKLLINVAKAEYKNIHNLKKLSRMDKAIIAAEVRTKTAAMARRAKEKGYTDKEKYDYLTNFKERRDFVSRKAANPITSLEDLRNRQKASAAKAKLTREKIRSLPEPARSEYKALLKSLEDFRIANLLKDAPTPRLKGPRPESKDPEA